MFEFDKTKSKTNKDKHGIDFVEAQAIWLDDNRLSVAATERDETRFIMIGVIAEKHWSAICTMRNESIRIISVRRSRKEEKDAYEGART